MAFKTIPGIEGKVYIPDEGSLRHRKHPCPDCYACQQCGEDRCRLCRAEEHEHMPPQGITRPDADRPPADGAGCCCH